MDENKEIPVLDFEEMLGWIESETDYDRKYDPTHS